MKPNIWWTKFRKKVNETSSHIKKINGFLLKSGNNDNAIRILYKIVEITLENLYFEINGFDQREPPPPLSPYASEFFQTFVHDSVILVFS